MKRKIFVTTMVMILGGGMAFGVSGYSGRTVLAQDSSDDSSDNAGENVVFTDYAKVSGVWLCEDTAREEDITITAEGLFIYHTKDMGDIQGYLEYVDEYGDGNGRYDMYNRVGGWLAGFYLDSDTSFHMGNVDGAVFHKIEGNIREGESVAYEAQTAGNEGENTGTDYVLTSYKRYTGLKPLYNNSDWNGGYYYSDMTEDGLTVIVNCSASNNYDFDGSQEEYRKQFVKMVSDYDIDNYEETQSAQYTEKFTYPAYEITFTTGANEDTCLWKMLCFQTDTDTFSYAYKMNIDWAEEMDEEYKDALDSLELTQIVDMESNAAADGAGNDGRGEASDDGNGQNNDGCEGSPNGADYDPSADGQSLEMFISYFDNWYQYGDLNATSIHLYGDGTWEIYNARNEDGSGGYLFDSGTFETSGTTALLLYSYGGSHVADVSLDGNGELLVSPVISGYGSIYADAAFSREGESVAYEAQNAGEGMGDYVPEEGSDYEEGRGDYIPDESDYSEDYVEESDPGDTYYWYDGEGNVMYYTGYEDVYIGPGDVYYIDGNGQLGEY